MSHLSNASSAASAVVAGPPWTATEIHRELRRVGQECVRRGFVVARQGNISVRHGNVMHITAAGSDLGALGEPDVVTVDLGHGTCPTGTARPSVEWALHARIYEQRSDVRAILHTHSPYATAWSYFDEPLAASSGALRPPVACPILTAAAAPAGTMALAHAAARGLENRSAVLLARHGVVGTGATLAQALDVCSLVEHHAHVAWLVRASASGVTESPS